jgi:hypothetical protein
MIQVWENMEYGIAWVYFRLMNATSGKRPLQLVTTENVFTFCGTGNNFLGWAREVYEAEVEAEVEAEAAFTTGTGKKERAVGSCWREECPWGCLHLTRRIDGAVMDARR